MRSNTSQMGKGRPTERFWEVLGNSSFLSQIWFRLSWAHICGHVQLCTYALCMVRAQHSQALGLHCGEMAFGCFSGMKLLNFCQCPASLIFSTNDQLVNERTHISFNVPLWRIFQIQQGWSLFLSWRTCWPPSGCQGTNPFNVEKLKFVLRIENWLCTESWLREQASIWSCSLFPGGA